jgi:hypothetical protein
VILALRYLGPGKRGKKGASEAQTRKDLGEMAQLPGMSRPQPLPGSLKELIAKAEQLKQKHKGL